MGVYEVIKLYCTHVNRVVWALKLDLIKIFTILIYPGDSEIEIVGCRTNLPALLKLLRFDISN
jgi:hypothetical protein